ncbi:MAG: hypothetical protein CVV31_13515 [Methanomicrobiales archaeon HGW-Methanomicrobiales-2]|nr:MAG: hypothetical protein CVV31_13515 [Methanomicrobiales archaeon HGW-Methanomicrobiales-2]
MAAKMPSAPGKESHLAPCGARTQFPWNGVPAGAPAPLLTEHRDYYITFTRNTVRISSREADAIRTAVRAPSADTVPALA